MSVRGRPSRKVKSCQSKIEGFLTDSFCLYGNSAALMGGTGILCLFFVLHGPDQEDTDQQSHHIQGNRDV